MLSENYPQNRNQKVRGQDNTDSTGSSMKFFSGTMTIQPVSIAVMGTTGSGKSTFINLVSGSTLSIYQSLRSSQQKVRWAREFILENRTVQLIDTPGFDDTTKSEVDILRNISAALENHYKAGARLHGVLYLHPVTDIGMAGASKRSFRLFRKMCGDDSLKNTAIVTTMWDTLTPDVAILCENELKTDPKFFQPALRRQAKLLRHNNTLESAHQIIREMFTNHPSPIDIQVELVEEQKHLSDTNAGNDVKGELDRLTLNFREAITRLEEELQSEPQGKRERKLQKQLSLSERKLEKAMVEMKQLKADHSLQSKMSWYQEELQSEPEGERELQKQLRLSERKLEGAMAEIKKLRAHETVASERKVATEVDELKHKERETAIRNDNKAADASIATEEKLVMAIAEVKKLTEDYFVHRGMAKDEDGEKSEGGRKATEILDKLLTTILDDPKSKGKGKATEIFDKRLAAIPDKPDHGYELRGVAQEFSITPSIVAQPPKKPVALGPSEEAKTFKQFSDTHAGKDIESELDRLMRNFKNNVTKLQRELQELLKSSEKLVHATADRETLLEPMKLELTEPES